MPRFRSQRGRPSCRGSRCRPRLRGLRSWLPQDARVFQILFLASLLTFGVLARDFTLRPAQMALAFAAGLATQACWLRAKGLQQKGFLSALVTCFGLSILLRSDTLWAHPLAACLAMSAKFVIRVNGKHLYNPANLGVIAALLVPARHVDFARAMGQRTRRRRLVRRAGRRGRAARAALGHRVVLPRRVARPGRAARARARPAVRRVGAPARERRAAAVRVLHDLRSDDDPQPARRARRLCADRRGRARSAGNTCCFVPTRSSGRCSSPRRWCP